MTFSWTPHRFSGGALALDVANSVILRHDDEQRVDRFAIASQLDSFAGAAAAYCAERRLFGDITPVSEATRTTFLGLRETIDRYFRARILDHGNDGLLADLLSSLSVTLREAPLATGLEAATAHSALRLVAMPEPPRMKICGNCGWLFIDRSKNRSRAWCDMAVCGNRAKASRHYKRRKEISA